MTVTIRSRGFKASYYLRRNRRMAGTFLEGLNDYCQWGYYECGFVAALSVVHYYYPEISDKKVLSTIKPLANWGVSRNSIINGLWEFGIHTEYRDDLTISKLRNLVRRGIPTIIACWPSSWYADHWAVVRGFSKNTVHLCNHYAMSNGEFEAEWIEAYGGGWTTGAGLITSLVE